LPLAFGSVACGPNVIFSETTAITNTEWTYADSAHFQFTIPTTETAYDFVLSVDHSNAFPYQNFYVVLHTGFPNGVRQSQQISLQLAGDFGEWKGRCAGENCEQDITFLRNARFEQTGAYYLTVVQHSRDEPLVGINGLGFSVVETQIE
ncbi:MAG: gliding motility lipoprotein GldH, partial [Bacteroidota bacterium]